MNPLLPKTTQMGEVTLRVENLDQMVLFYSNSLGLEVLSSAEGVVKLGHGTQVLLVLVHSPELKYAGSHEAGLFHTAFLFESRTSLATAVRNLAANPNGRFTGSADHLVSEAFYFDDPEGNGVELYFDRNRSDWSWSHGQIQMGTYQLDPNEYLRNHLGEFETAIPNRIGHVHLSVGNIEQARDFYVDKLGFETTLNWGNTALFVSAGGYHHHMAMNIWRSRGAGRRQLALGLGQVKIELDSEDAILATKDRLGFYGQTIQDTNSGFITFDPWGNEVALSLS